MDKRSSKRLPGTSEVTLFDLSGWLLTTASIADLSEGGMLVAYLPEDKADSFVADRQVRFQFTLSTGEVRGLAVVVRVDAERRELGLRLLQIDNEEGLPHLLAFLHAWLCGVD